MKKKKLFTTLLLAALGVMLVACRPSDAKLAEAEDARTVLLEARQAAEETFLDITDSSNKEKLNELATKTAEIEAIDFTKMSDKKIDEVLPTINEITTQYQSMGSSMSAILKEETDVRLEKAKHEERDVFFINKTGMNLTKLMLHDLTQDSYSENFIGNGVTLADGYTLMGVTLDVYEDSSEWEFVMADEGGTEYFLTCGDLKKLDPAGVTIVLEYDIEANEGTAGVPASSGENQEGGNATEEIKEGAAEASSGN